MGGREDDDYPDEMEERLINDEYKVGVCMVIVVLKTRILTSRNQP